jgi:hypothetical protein
VGFRIAADCVQASYPVHPIPVETDLPILPFPYIRAMRFSHPVLLPRDIQETGTYLQSCTDFTIFLCELRLFDLIPVCCMSARANIDVQTGGYLFGGLGMGALAVVPIAMYINVRRKIRQRENPEERDATTRAKGRDDRGGRQSV